MTCRSVGREKQPRRSVRNVEPVPGSRNGRLLLIGDAGRNEKGERLVEVVCDCGVEKVIRFCNFTNNTKSCGCFRREDTVARSTGNLESIAANKVFYSCTRRCRKNGWAIDLTRELVQVLIFADRCFYCDRTREASGIVWYRKDQNLQRKITRLGIDRIDSNLGYLQSNCVPCCFVCNSVKLDRKLELLATTLPGMLRRVQSLVGLQVESVDEHY